jgi:hypothetical protein
LPTAPYLALELFLALARHHSILLIIIEKVKDNLALFQLAQKQTRGVETMARLETPIG